MNRIVSISMAAAFGICAVGNVFAADMATKEECVAKVMEAAAMIQKDGLDAAKAEIGKKDGKFVWKDSYVFLLNATGKMLAHPIKPELTEKENTLDLKDSNGKAFVLDIIKLANQTGTGWVDYAWPKPGEEGPSLKSSYVYKVPGTDLILGAGVYPTP